MKYILLLSLILCSSINAQNCDNFKQGAFELKGDFGTLIIERKGCWQLEKSSEYSLVYLNKIEPINDCKYKLYRYKILESGGMPKPDMETVSITEITNVDGEKYYFESSLIGTDMVMKNYFTKISDEVSNEFKEIIANESKCN